MAYLNNFDVWYSSTKKLNFLDKFSHLLFIKFHFPAYKKHVDAKLAFKIDLNLLLVARFVLFSTLHFPFRCKEDKMFKARVHYFSKTNVFLR